MNTAADLPLFEGLTQSTGIGSSAGSETLRLNEIVERRTSLYRRLCGSRITFEIDLQPGLDTVLHQTAQTEDLLLHLVLNAVNLLPFGGAIVLSTSNVRCAEQDLGYGRYVRVLLKIHRSSPNEDLPTAPHNGEKAKAIRSVIETMVHDSQGWFTECQESERVFWTEVLLRSVALQDTRPIAAA